MFELYGKLLLKILCKLQGVDSTFAKSGENFKSLKSFHKRLFVLANNGNQILDILDCNTRGEEINKDELVDLIRIHENLISSKKIVYRITGLKLCERRTSFYLSSSGALGKKRQDQVSHVWIQFYCPMGTINEKPSLLLQHYFKKFHLPLYKTS